MSHSSLTKSFQVITLLVALTLLLTAPASAAFLTFVQVVRDGVGGVDGLAFATSVAVSPDGAHVYVTGYSDNAVAVFTRDRTTGALTFLEVQKDGVGGVDGLRAATSVTVSPDGAHVYVAGHLDNAVAVFSRDRSTGGLTFVEVQRDGVGGVDGLRGATSVAVSPDGAHAYATGAYDYKLVVFSRDGTTGALTFVEKHTIQWPTSVTVSPDGAHVYAAGGYARAVVVFSRNRTTGVLTFVEKQAVQWAASVTVSPDGAHVYATGWDDDTVMVFSRDGTTGALTFVEKHTVQWPTSVTVSSDGAHVYATSRGDDALVVFSRDRTTGRLAFLEVHKDGMGGVDGLDCVQSVTVSPDGAHIYAAGGRDDAVAVFLVTGQQPSRVEAVAPAPNSHTAAASTNLTATVSGAVSQTTVTPQTFVVHGGFQGHLDGVFNFGGTADASDIVFDPVRDFHPGELVETSATQDVVVGDIQLDYPYVWQFHTAVEGGSGYFVDSGQRLDSSDSWWAALGDLDGDGDLDAFIGNRSEQANIVWLNDSTGTFGDSGQKLGNSGSHMVALGDLDVDGDLDAFAANGNWEGEADKVWLNDGTGGFVDSGQNLGNSYSVAVALGDVDGDGDFDAFVGNWAGQANLVWLNDGAGHFDDSGQRLGNSSSGDVALGDLDDDGDVDAFVANGSRGEADRIWLNDGTGAFADSGQRLGSSDSLGVALGDLDDDGDLDVFVVHRKTGEQPDEVWLNDGSGHFIDSSQRLGTSWSDGVALGDLDGDGDLDAIVGNAHGQANEVWLNDGMGTLTESSQTLGSSHSRAVPLGDLDSDGDLDVFVANSYGHANKVWLNQPAPSPPAVWSDINAPHRVEVTGIGMGDREHTLNPQTLSLADPEDVSWLRAQVAGRVAFSTPAPESVTFTTDAPQSVTLVEPSSSLIGYTFEADLEPTGQITATVSGIGDSYRTPRGLVLYGRRATEELWTSVGKTTNNYVYAGRGEYTHTEVLTFPPLEEATDLYVTAAVIDNDDDSRPMVVEATAGGITAGVTELGPTDGAGLNIVDLALPRVPAGTDQISVTLQSPPGNGDSLVLVGLNVSYPCGQPSVITVPCDTDDLINAINTANSNGMADTLNLAAGCTYTLTDADNDTDGPNGLPSITTEIVIYGNKAAIERSSVAGTPAFRIFHVAAEGDLALNELTVRNGLASGGGGGVYNEGTVTLTNSTVSSNTANGGGGIENSFGTLMLTNSTVSSNTANGGGGILNQQGMVTLIDSTVNGNSARVGGGIDNNAGEMTLTNSTVSDNSATDGTSGGILGDGPTTLTNSTVSGNSATDSPGGVFGDSGPVTLTNTIVGNQLSGGDCYGQDAIISLGHNLDSDGSCGFNAPGDITADPMLGPLQDNGGPTWTHALLLGSPAIDAGDDNTCPSTDQRGEPRPADGDGDGTANCDIGAYEFWPALSVSKRASPNPVQPGAPLAYTIAVTNTGTISLTLRITDTLPAQVTHASGRDTLVWTPPTLTPGDAWTHQFTVTVASDTNGSLTNSVLVWAEEGVTGSASVTVSPARHYSYLPVVMK